MFGKNKPVHLFKLRIVSADEPIFDKLAAFAEKLTKINPNVQVEVEVDNIEIKKNL